MVDGMSYSIWLSVFVVWVAISFPDVTSFIEKIEQRLGNTLSRLLTIFAHPHQRGPVPGAKDGKNNEPSQSKPAIWKNKAIEIRQLIFIDRKSTRLNSSHL